MVEGPKGKEKREEKRAVVAFLGPEGTFSEQAARRWFRGMDVAYLSLGEISEIFNAVTSHRAAYGVVPIENSMEGSVNLTLDLLYKSEVKIMGEIEEPVRHCLIAKPGVDLKDIRVVFSHPQALAQSRSFLEKRLPHARIEETSSTASAVVKIRRSTGTAAIGSELAAKVYGLKVLAKGIEVNPHNATRFLILSQEDNPPTSADRTSIVFAAKNIPGALYKALAPFAERGINLTKIESRPSRDKPWEYIFFLDFEGHREEPICREALKELGELCQFVKILGSYPRARN